MLASKHKHVTGRKTDSPSRLCFQAMAGVVWSTPAARTVRQARSGRSAEEWPSWTLQSGAPKIPKLVYNSNNYGL